MKDLYIDIGSTNIKWATNGKKKVYNENFPLPSREEEVFYEVSEKEIINTIKKIINIAMPNRVFFSVQMHGYLLLKDGEAVSDYISWRDERGGNTAPDFCITEEYGVGVKPNLPRLSLQTQKIEYDEFCTLGSYISHCLTGKNISHITDCAPSGFFNVKEKTRDIVSFKLPIATYQVEPVGTYNGALIYTPTGDQQASVLGAVGLDFNGLILNLGTAGQMCCIEDEFVTGEYESRPFFGGKILCTVTRIKGGRFIDENNRDDLEDLLVADYKMAKNKLPKNNKMVVIGGVIQYKKDLLSCVLNKLNVNYTFNNECSAINGLKIIARGVK